MTGAGTADSHATSPGTGLVDASPRAEGSDPAASLNSPFRKPPWRVDSEIGGLGASDGSQGPEVAALHRASHTPRSAVSRAFPASFGEASDARRAADPFFPRPARVATGRYARFSTDRPKAISDRWYRSVPVGGGSVPRPSFLGDGRRTDLGDGRGTELQPKVPSKREPPYRPPRPISSFWPLGRALSQKKS